MDSVRTAILIESEEAGFKATMMAAVDVEAVEAEVVEEIVMTVTLAVFRSMITPAIRLAQRLMGT